MDELHNFTAVFEGNFTFTAVSRAGLWKYSSPQVII